MAKKRMCIISVQPVLSEVENRIQQTNAPFTAEQWICINLAEIKAIPMPFAPNKHYVKGVFGDLVSLLHNTVNLPCLVVDKDIDYRFVGNTLLLSF